MKRKNYKLLRVVLTALTVMGILLAASAVVVSTTAYAQSRDRNGGDDGGGGDGNGGPTGSDIVGTITNAVTGEPGNGFFVRVNDILVRADAMGNWSLTGLPPGEYVVALDLTSEFSPAQDPQVVSVTGNSRVALDLEYYVGPAPQPTPVPTLPPTPTPLPAAVPTATPAPGVGIPDAPPAGSPGELPDAGGLRPDDVGAAQAEPSAETTISTTSATLCNAVYVVQNGDSLSTIAAFFLGDPTAYPRIVEATLASRVENPGFADVQDPNTLAPGEVLCIPPQ